jgi:hypothetical protein
VNAASVSNWPAGLRTGCIPFGATDSGVATGLCGNPMLDRPLVKTGFKGGLGGGKSCLAYQQVQKGLPVSGRIEVS